MIRIKAQVTVFIVIAILLVAGVGTYFLLRGDMMKTSIPRELEPVYDHYLACVNEHTINGAAILGQQGGYINTPEFSPGSVYMPFSSKLGFLGTGIPYWFYISGNGVIKEQVPSKEKMESELNDFLKERVSYCDFSQFEEQGFEISLGEVKEVSSVINDNLISVNVKQDIGIGFENTTWVGKSHKRDVKSNLGKFFKLALKIYKKQKNEMFLENYGIDILRLYAPVDGTEISCASKIWSIDEVREKLMGALEANIPEIKIKGNYYKLAKEENKYFVQDIGEDIDTNVNFLYARQWPMKMEVWPSENGILKADPVGNQEGLGMLGFCYVPYHFVYDFAFPVLVQLYNEDEVFQFPTVVYIDKNKPREALDAEGLADVVPELCKYKNTRLSVSTYDTKLQPIEADISFKCFDTSCSIGRTRIVEGNNAVLNADFPQCVNGYIIANANGYKTKKYIISSLSENSIQIVLDKKYKLDLEVQSSGKDIGNGDYAVVTFARADDTVNVVYPEQKEVELSEGQYEIKVYVYSNANINLAGGSTNKCITVSQSGFLESLGSEEEKCFELNIPNQVISSAITGGGKQKYYITESELQDSKTLVIDAENFGTPVKVEDLQANYNKLETSTVDLRFE